MLIVCLQNKLGLWLALNVIDIGAPAQEDV